jgi:anti-sigma regulatory factor (Ser/Thr protein kinase)
VGGHVDVRLPVSVHAPATARRRVVPIAGGLHPNVRDNLALLVSELVSNSVRHGAHLRSRILLRAWVIPPAARVTVADSGPGFEPSVELGEPGECLGRGLWLVNHIADTWGICLGVQTCTWFELHGGDGMGRPPDLAPSSTSSRNGRSGRGTWRGAW